MFKQLINKPIAVTMVLIAVLVLGVAAINMLPVSLVPDIDIPQITVQVSSAGKSARELNETMINPLRSQLVQVPHLNQINCTAKDGSGVISMVFDYGSDADYIFIDVNERIDRAMANWPRGEDRPVVARASATDIPAFFINITLADSIVTEQQTLEMSSFARQVIVRRIEQLPEVAMVDVSGLLHPELLIVPDMEKLQSLGITEQQLSEAVNGANVHLGSLSIRDGEYRFDVRFESALLNRTDVEDVWLKIHDRVYQLKDLAEVREQPQTMKGMITSDGRQCVTMAVIKRTEARMADLQKGVSKLMEAFAEDYPTMRFTVTRDQTELLDYSINNMIKNLIFGALFACLIIFFFMHDFKSPMLVVVTIPTALILSFLFFYVIGISINVISLSGLVLGLGMMVDNSIITIDNITQRWRKGEMLPDACVYGSQEVFTPMLSSVLTTCAIFVPMIFMSGIAGALFYDEAMAVSITLMSALAVSVLLMPVLYNLLYKRQSQNFGGPLPREKGLWLTRIYDRWLKWLFRRRAVVWAVLGASVVLIGVLFANLEKRKLPLMAHSDTLVSIEWNERITVEENNRRCQSLVGKFGDLIKQSTCMVGTQQFVLSHTGELTPTEAVIYIKAASASDIEQIERQIGETLRTQWPQAVVSSRAAGNIFDMIFAEKEPPLTVRLRATGGEPPTPAALTAICDQIRAALPYANVQPIEWNDYIELVADPERLTLYGASYDQIMQYLRNAMNDNQVLRISKGEISEPIVIGAGQKQASDLISGYQIQTKGGGSVPLDVLMKETRNRDLKTITSSADGEYYPIPLDISSRQVEPAMAAIRDVVRQNSGFEVDFGGAYFSNRDLIKELCMVLLISVLLLFFILAAQFESLVQPLIIMLELLTDIFAAMLVLKIFGESLNLMSMIGIVVMCGIVINDSILKVDTINRLRRGGMGLKRAIMEAGQRRLKPIIMTSLTTILAIAPFLVKGDMGSDLQYPLSLALISGMVAGTLVSIFFVPIAYYVIYRKSEK